MIILFFFGICFLGFSDCEDTPTFQEEMNQLINLAYDCGKINGITNWTPKGSFGGKLKCIITYPDNIVNGIIPVFTKTYDTIDDTMILTDNNCFYTQSNGTWVLSHCEGE